MNCPKCQEPMFVLEYERVEIDVCDDCGGIWLDTGELETILGTGRASTGQPTKNAKGEELLDCPVCVSKLAKGKYGTTEIIVDRCPHGDGVFLDKGELEAIQQHYASQSETSAGHEDVAGRFLSKFFAANEPPQSSGS